jgi:hypothetical protein
VTRYVGLHDNGKSSFQGFFDTLSSLLGSGVSAIANVNAWKVSQRAAGTNMSVDIAAGKGLIASSVYSYPCWSDAVENVTISAASPSNPRRDIIVAYIDMSVPSAAVINNQDALKFKVVTGTAAASPSDPSSATIQASVGAGNPWIYLARVSVPTSGSPVVDAWITDLRQPISFRGKLWGGSNNINGHTVPNVADDTVSLLGADQTYSGNRTFGGQVNLQGYNMNGAMTAYACSWTALTTNPTLGNATFSASYIRVGKMVTVQIQLIMGTTTGYGSSDWLFSLPPGLPVISGKFFTGPVYGIDGGTAYHSGIVSNGSPFAMETTKVTLMREGGGVGWRSTEPHTWASGDALAFTFTYETA